MKKLASHFRFNKQERSGIFFLLLIIVFLQIAYVVLVSSTAQRESGSFALDQDVQSQIDRLKKDALRKDTLKIYPFNPNYITDHKGYTLGMSVEEIDRLHAFRAGNRFANSAEEFQKVTGVSDSLLKKIAPYFKFPEWTQNIDKTSAWKSNNKAQNDYGAFVSNDVTKNIQDLNTATPHDLKKIRGIGEKLSARIVKFRNRLGGFLIDEQLYDVYGLEPEVVERALRRFSVIQKPDIKKININSASVQELSQLVYIQKKVAEKIVDYRNDNGSIGSFDELANIENFPSEKIERIALYLSL